MSPDDSKPSASDWAITAVALAIVVGLIWLVVGLFSGEPEGANRFSDKVQPGGFSISPRDAYGQAKDLCGAFSIAKLVADLELGASPDDPVAVASAYAEQSLVEPFRAAGTAGCLAALIDE